ncbi:MAG: hypothetical protein V2J26_05530 [Pacificimonas sp.]|jgi:hypothetical protein|nr:hypothetical protein [Pacificimonas sp.]
MSVALSIDEQRQARAVRDLIAAAGGLEAAHEITGKSTSQLSRCQSPTETCSLTLRDIEALEAVTHGHRGHPAVTAYLAARAGYALAKLPDVQAGGTDLNRLVGEQARTFGGLAAEVTTALSDGKWTREEIRQAKTALHALRSLSATMSAELDAKEEELRQ